MFDKRVVRGNTYSSHVLGGADGSVLNASGNAGNNFNNGNATGVNRTAKKKSVRQRDAEFRADTPDAVEGREHRDVQTENYLEEITDRVIEVDVVTQTDTFMDRPSTPVYVPKKEGVDSETQIYEGDLFDFDLEVEPILEVLIGKTLEQGVMEVMEEEELANLRAHQEEFIELRNAELAETQRLEEAERRRFEEKERRLRQERDRQEKERERKEIAAAREFAQTYLSSLETAVFNNLSETGYFHDPVLKEVENEFIPWIEDRINGHIDRAHLEKKLADDLVRHGFVVREMRRKEEAERMEQARIRQNSEARLAEEQRKDEVRRVRDEAARKLKAEMEAKKRAQEAKEAAEREAEESSDEPPPEKKKGSKKK